MAGERFALPKGHWPAMVIVRTGLNAAEAGCFLLFTLIQSCDVHQRVEASKRPKAKIPSIKSNLVNGRGG
jgi:hypothetical protein